MSIQDVNSLQQAVTNRRVCRDAICGFILTSLNLLPPDPPPPDLYPRPRGTSLTFGRIPQGTPQWSLRGRTNACRHTDRDAEHDVPLRAYQFLRVATTGSKPSSKSKQDPSAIRGIGGDIRKTSCYPAYIPIPCTAGCGMSLAVVADPRIPWVIYIPPMLWQY